MPSNLTEQTITEAVQRSFDTADDERFRELFVALVGHLHDFAREVRLSDDELYVAADFVKRLGQFSNPTRQEVLLLADILGLSVLVEQIDQPSGSSATESSVLGPFYRDDRPTAADGADISGGVTGTPMFVSCHVHDEQGRPIAGAEVDTWHSDGDGRYDLQQTERRHGEPAMRARLITGETGHISYRSVTPTAYPVATDGPCGEILRAARRPVMRPQHIHFRVRGEGFRPLITQLFLRDDPNLQSDSIFAAQDALLADFVRHDGGNAPDGSSITGPFVTLEWTFVLAAAAP